MVHLRVTISGLGVLFSRCDIVQLISTHTAVLKITGLKDGLFDAAIIGVDIWNLPTSL